MYDRGFDNNYSHLSETCVISSTLAPFCPSVSTYCRDPLVPYGVSGYRHTDSHVCLLHYILYCTKDPCLGAWLVYDDQSEGYKRISHAEFLHIQKTEFIS